MQIPSLLPTETLRGFEPGDYLVLFGELFQKGYANGLVEAAKEKGMIIVRSTVGRRDENQNLRPLNAEECQNIPVPFISVPLECSFDLEPNSQGQTPVDLCKTISLRDGLNAKLDFDSLNESRAKGQTRFRQQVKEWVSALETILVPNKKVLVAHLMAGGVPRSKVILGLMNRVFKGTGDRHIGSSTFWSSDIGRFCEMSFLDVTAGSFNVLIEETSRLRAKQEAAGGAIHYSAYGYHGTPIYVNDSLQWLSYTPYIQGFAKKKLEDYAREHWSRGVKATVYNCPEILTNSSGIFPGVEIFLYSLLFEIRKRHLKTAFLEEKLTEAESCVLPQRLPEVKQVIDQYLNHPTFKKSIHFESWPGHSNHELMEVMLNTSDKLITLHKSPQELMTFPLSEIVIKACGALMLEESYNPSQPVWWLGHDAVINYFEREIKESHK